MPLPQIQANSLTRPTIPTQGGSGPFIPAPPRPAPQRTPRPTGGPLVPPTKPASQQQPGVRQGEGYQNWQSGNNAQRQQFLQRQQRMQQAGGVGAIRNAQQQQVPPIMRGPIQTSMPQVQASALGGGGFAALPPGAAGQWRPDRIWT